MGRIVDNLKDEDKVLIDDETEVIASPVILTEIVERDPNNKKYEKV